MWLACFAECAPAFSPVRSGVCAVVEYDVTCIDAVLPPAWPLADVSSTLPCDTAITTLFFIGRLHAMFDALPHRKRLVLLLDEQYSGSNSVSDVKLCRADQRLVAMIRAASAERRTSIERHLHRHLVPTVLRIVRSYFPGRKRGAPCELTSHVGCS